MFLYRNISAMNIRNDQLLDNIQFNENAVIEKTRKGSQRCTPPATEPCSGNKKPE